MGITATAASNCPFLTETVRQAGLNTLIQFVLNTQKVF